ncbi:hypothetical protein OE88DRAFT_1644074 [Heliocybe sulcata]|uniref:Uncharacterized protein n=1 Tax=Heliocybe sulcata TaxID=5364 RepID=A0A5C3N417_9AGAM|nr:hypothetical protein OE88DRAFT_1644074 [Heliocybe sulcata]
MSQSNPFRPPPYEAAAGSAGAYRPPTGPPPHLQQQSHTTPQYPSASYSAQAAGGQSLYTPPAPYSPPSGPPPQMQHQDYTTDPYNLPSGQLQQTPPVKQQAFSMSSIIKIFAGPSNPLDPPPPSFSRQTPQWVTYEQFPMMVTLGLGKELGDGFAELPPPSALQPHPFQRHDVQEADWHRFLGDIKAAGKLTLGENIISNVAPMTMHIGLTGMLVTKAIENKQRQNKQDPCGMLVDAWNNYFFRPRRLEVVLAKGNMRISGNTDMGVPDWRHGDDSSSSSEDEQSNKTGGSGRLSDRRFGARRQGMRDRRRGEGLGQRDARRTKRRQEKANKKEHYRLIVVPA